MSAAAALGDAIDISFGNVGPRGWRRSPARVPKPALF
jgi:hypothetical protein